MAGRIGLVSCGFARLSRHVDSRPWIKRWLEIWAYKPGFPAIPGLYFFHRFSGRHTGTGSLARFCPPQAAEALYGSDFQPGDRRIMGPLASAPAVER